MSPTTPPTQPAAANEPPATELQSATEQPPAPRAGTFLGNDWQTWAIGLSGAIVAFTAGEVARRMVRSWARKRLVAGGVRVRDLWYALASRLSLTLSIAAGLGAIQILVDLPAAGARVVRFAIVASLAWQGAIWANVLVQYLVDLLMARRRGPDGAADPSLASSLGIVRFAALMVLYLLIALLAAENLGVDVTALIAGVGIGGIAVALASQGILTDLFASLSIVMDKPFEVGDFIVVGAQKGTVEQIGVKTTRLRALSGEQVVVPNSDLLGSRIQNFKRMRERRAEFTIGVEYSTPRDKLERVAGIIREAISSRQGVRFDRAHFRGFGESSIDFEAVYFVLSPDYNAYMDIQQAINLDLLRRFDAEGISFPFPTRTVFLRR